MLKKIIILFLILSVFLPACGTLEVKLYQTPAFTPPASTQPGVTAAVGPAQTSTQPASPVPATQPPGPTFSDVSFFRTVGVKPGCSPSYQRLFPARVLRVYAAFQYANMRAGLTMHRAWYHDGQLWSEQDEAWDFAKYGANGTISDVYIYDFDAGLAPGKYELRLSIDRQPQYNANSMNSFQVDEAWTLESKSPNGLLTAILSEPQKLMIREASGTKWERLRANEISSLAWFPDSRHILYTDTDRSRTQGCTTVGIQHRLWLVDVATGQKFQIGSDGQNLHQAVISPDGRRIAALTGSGWFDAGMVDLGLQFIQLDGNLQPVSGLGPQDFAGSPGDTSAGHLYPENSPAAVGVWRDNTHFQIGLNWVGMATGIPSGIYLFDLAARDVARIGDLPKP